MTLAEVARDLSFAAGVLRGRPFQVLLQVTNRCNMRCDFCGFWCNAAPPDEELSLEEFQKLERELTGMGKFLVSLEGGEPLVRRDVTEIVRIFSARHLPVLYTNGWHVTEGLARELFAAGLVQVGVSIDYPDAARHDRKRGVEGAWERAWRAVELLRDAAPHGGRQVHVMTVLMEENRADLDALFAQSAARGVQHCLTLLTLDGDRRGEVGSRPPRPPVSAELLKLWRRHSHLKVFRDYLATLDAFLSDGEGLPGCRAGTWSFNVDHQGNVSPCIERIGQVIGNLREETLAAIHARLTELEEVRACQDCWTVCRGFQQALGGGGTLRGWLDLGTRMRSA